MDAALTEILIEVDEQKSVVVRRIVEIHFRLDSVAF